MTSGVNIPPRPRKPKQARKPDPVDAATAEAVLWLLTMKGR